jgi:hypothetical protein
MSFPPYLSKQLNGKRFAVSLASLTAQADTPLPHGNSK